MTELPARLLAFVDFENNPRITTLDQLVDTWLLEHKANTSGTTNGPATDIELGLTMFQHDRDLLWTFIKSVVQKSTPKSQIGMIAAGPLESLIADSGTEFIDDIETLARRSPRFRYVLTGVWPQGQRESAIWRRIEVARQLMMETGIDSGADMPSPD